MKSVWHTKRLDSDSWQASRYEDAVAVEIAVASWPFRQIGELVTGHTDAGVANHRPPLITPRDVDRNTGEQVSRERAGLQPVLELDRELAEGDILLPRSSNRPAVLLTQDHRGFAFSTGFIALRVNSTELEPRYLWMLLSSSRGMRARAELLRPDVDWEDIQRIRIAVPPLAFQRAHLISVPVPVVRWAVRESRWRIQSLRQSKSWASEPLNGLDGIRLGDIAQISSGTVEDDHIFAVPGDSRVPVLSDIGLTEVSPRDWAEVSPNNVSAGFDIAVSPHFPFRASRVPAGWSVGRRFLIVRPVARSGYQTTVSVDGLVGWFNSISGRDALAVVASGAVLPRLNVSALSRVRIPESEGADNALEKPLAERLELALAHL
jgi:hypothetical protein